MRNNRLDYYQDVTWEYGQPGEFSPDPETPMVVLCERCALEHADRVEWAGECAEEDGIVCEICGE